MFSRILMYVCLAGAGGCGLAAAALWVIQHGREPVGRLTCAYRRLPLPLKVLLLLYLGVWMVYGSTKAPTNPPPLTAPAPRRVSRDATDEPWRVGTNERWDFTCPDWATVVEQWERRGAFDDWADAGELGVLFAQGRVQIGDTSFALYDRPLALVPAAVSAGTNGFSRVWYGRSPWDSEVWTWQNASVDRDTNEVVSVQLERLANGDRIYRYGGSAPVTSRAYLSPRPPDADSDGDGIPDVEDPAMMDPDADGDGIVDGISRAEFEAHPLWRWNSSGGEFMDVTQHNTLVEPAKAVLTIGTLRILLTTNAVYHLRLQDGVLYKVKLTTNGFQAVDLTAGEGVE